MGLASARNRISYDAGSGFWPMLSIEVDSSPNVRRKRASASTFDTYSCAPTTGAAASVRSISVRSAGVTPSLRYTDISAALLHSSPSWARLAVTRRNPPSTNSASAIVAVESIPACRPRHKLATASSMA